MSDVNEKLSGLKTILHKAQEYCAYQERCPFDVEQKLHLWGVDKERSKKIIEKLIKENFIDEARYARSFVRGKFLYNKWGKLKITNELRSKKIKKETISTGLDEINDDEYFQTIKTLAQKKETEIKENDLFKKKQKVARFLISRGFEPSLVFEILKTHE